MTQDECESERNDQGRKKKRKKKEQQQKNGKVGEAEMNEKIGQIARINRCRNKTNTLSPPEWYRDHRETNTA